MLCGILLILFLIGCGPIGWGILIILCICASCTPNEKGKVTKEIEELNDLFKKNLITEEEFALAKQRCLGYDKTERIDIIKKEN